MFDLAIIGGGPCGYNTAIYARDKGLSAVLFEVGELGGTCLNRGCIPTKALLKSVGLYSRIRHAGAYGIGGVDGAVVNFSEMYASKDKIVETLRRGVAGQLAGKGIEVVKAHAYVKAPGLVVADGIEYPAKNILLATGSKPAPLRLEGGDSLPDSDDILKLDRQPERLAIIGGGAIGVEFAFIFAGLGSQVTLYEVMDRVLPSADKDISEAAGSLLLTAGVRVMVNTRIARVEEGSILHIADGHAESFDFIMSAAGRKSVLEYNTLDHLGIRQKNGWIHTDEWMRTSVEGIYAAGDANGKMMLAHTAVHEGRVAVDHILGHARALRYDRIPQCVFTSPEIAWIGLTEEEALARGILPRVVTYPLSHNGRAAAEREADGFIKLIADTQTGEVLGAHMICPQAGELISEISLALSMEATMEELLEAVHPHPTISESIWDAATQWPFPAQ